MPTRLRSLLSLLTIALLLAAAEPARADGGHANSSEITLDGYTITLTTPQGDAQTGKNLVEITLHDGHRQPLAGATVIASLLAYASGEGGHGDSHGEAVAADSHSEAVANDHSGAAAADSHAEAPTTDTHGHAAADTHAEAATTDTHGHAAADTHGEAAPADAHDDSAAHAQGTDGQGLASAPVALVAGSEPGVYRGELSFDQPGTYTLGVVFTVDGEERGETFALAVAQRRPRELVLGGFALVNTLAIGAAFVLKRRTPTRPAKSTRPAAAAATTPEEQP